ncbi:MAG TPA: dienelactone hydrolase family protein, partial [Blastocatellia bacterium]|nr:dienelactone hydrolase family protein [Blastocatellia bacterium]
MTKEAEITASRETFEGEGLEVEAFVARPDDLEKAPAVIIVHEWWGLNRHIEDVARRFAEEGFIAVAADLYEGKTTKDAQEAA